MLSPDTQKALLMIGGVEVNPGPPGPPEARIDNDYGVDVLAYGWGILAGLNASLPPDAIDTSKRVPLNLSKFPECLVSNLRAVARAVDCISQSGPHKGEPNVSWFLSDLFQGKLTTPIVQDNRRLQKENEELNGDKAALQVENEELKALHPSGPSQPMACFLPAAMASPAFPTMRSDAQIGIAALPHPAGTQDSNSFYAPPMQGGASHTPATGTAITSSTSMPGSHHAIEGQTSGCVPMDAAPTTAPAQSTTGKRKAADVGRTAAEVEHENMNRLQNLRAKVRRFLIDEHRKRSGHASESKGDLNLVQKMRKMEDILRQLEASVNVNRATYRNLLEAARGAMVNEVKDTFKEVAAAVEIAARMGLNDRGNTKLKQHLSLEQVLHLAGMEEIKAARLSRVLHKSIRSKLRRSGRIAQQRYYNGQVELWVHMRDVGHVTVEALKALRKALPRFIPCEERLSRARSMLNSKAAKLFPMFHCLPKSVASEADDEHVGKTGVAIPLIRAIQLWFGKIVEDNPDVFTDLDNIVGKLCITGDGTVAGRKWHAITHMMFRFVNDGLEHMWQSAKHHFSVGLFDGGDCRENLKANAREIWRAVTWLLSNKLPIFVKGKERLVTIQVILPGDMKFHWEVLAIVWRQDHMFCPLCTIRTEDLKYLYEWVEPPEGQSLKQFVEHYDMDIPEVTVLNPLQLADREEAALAEENYTANTKGVRPPEERLCKLARYLPNSQGDGILFPANAGFLRVWRKCDVRQDYPHSLVPGIQAEQLGFDAEHYPMRIGEAMMKFILEKALHGGGGKAAGHARIDALNQAYKDAKVPFQYRLAKEGEPSTGGYASVGLDGNQIRKLAATHKLWLQVAESWREEIGECPLLSQSWELFHELILASREEHLDSEGQRDFWLKAKRFIRTFFLMVPSKNAGGFYLHTIHAHARMVLEAYLSLWRCAQSGTEGHHKDFKEVYRHSTGFGGAAGTTAGAVISRPAPDDREKLGLKGSQGVQRQKGVYKKQGSCPMQKFLERQGRMWAFTARDYISQPGFYTWLENDKTPWLVYPEWDTDHDRVMPPTVTAMMTLMTATVGVKVFHKTSKMKTRTPNGR
eukprot:jgi/Mesvir1/24800/Mv22053-RA.1